MSLYLLVYSRTFHRPRRLQPAFTSMLGEGVSGLMDCWG